MSSLKAGHFPGRVWIHEKKFKLLFPGGAAAPPDHPFKSAYRPPGFAGLLSGWLAGWLAGLLAGWLAGLLACWLAGLILDAEALLPGKCTEFRPKTQKTKRSCTKSGRIVPESNKKLIHFSGQIKVKKCAHT